MSRKARFWSAWPTRGFESFSGRKWIIFDLLLQKGDKSCSQWKSTATVKKNSRLSLSVCVPSRTFVIDVATWPTAAARPEECVLGGASGQALGPGRAQRSCGWRRRAAARAARAAHDSRESGAVGRQRCDSGAACSHRHLEHAGQSSDEVGRPQAGRLWVEGRGGWLPCGKARGEPRPGTSEARESAHWNGRRGRAEQQWRREIHLGLARVWSWQARKWRRAAQRRRRHGARPSPGGR